MTENAYILVTTGRIEEKNILTSVSTVLVRSVEQPLRLTLQMNREDENSSSTEESSEEYGEERFEFDWVVPNFCEKDGRIDSEVFEGKAKWYASRKCYTKLLQATDFFPKRLQSGRHFDLPEVL